MVQSAWCTLILLAGSAAAASAATLTHAYNLNGTYSDALGGPALTPNGGSVAANGYTFGAGQGLDAAGLLNNDTNYSIAMRVEFSNLPAGNRGNGYIKLLDFTNLAGVGGTDPGLYYFNGVLQFFSYIPSGSPAVSSGDFHTVVLTRDGTTNSMVLYLDGTPYETIDDTANHFGVLTTPSTPLWF